MDPMKTCPRCPGMAHRIRLSDKEISKNHHLMELLRELGRKNPVAMGVTGGIFVADRLGLVKVYLCQKCHHPFVSL